MKKYVFIFIALLLCSCKPSNTFESHTDAVSVQSLSVKDSLRTDFSFLFDRLDMWTYDTIAVDSDAKSRPQMVKHISISNGTFRSVKTENKVEVQNDSTVMKEQDVIHAVNTPPKLQTLIILVLAVILCFTIISQRSKVYRN